MKSLEDMTLTGTLRDARGRRQRRRFVASDRARTMTAATVNVSCGALID